ncbi:hypothetical protein Tco_0936421 [Tanacetum coccineum]
MHEVKRLTDFKAEKEKSKKKLRRVITPEQLRAQEEELAAIEAKRVKMMDEFNHCTNFRDDYLPITKFSYRVNNLTAFDLSTTEKKMKRRTKLIQEVFIKENIVVDGIQSSYLYVIAHWIDPETWLMMKRTIAFEDFLVPHSGLALFKMLRKGEQQSFDASPGQVSSALVVHSSYEEPPMKKLKVLLDIPIPASTPLNTFRLITIDDLAYK